MVYTYTQCIHRTHVHIVHYLYSVLDTLGDSHKLVRELMWLGNDTKGETGIKVGHATHQNRMENYPAVKVRRLFKERINFVLLFRKLKNS